MSAAEVAVPVSGVGNPGLGDLRPAVPGTGMEAGGTAAGPSEWRKPGFEGPRRAEQEASHAAEGLAPSEEGTQLKSVAPTSAPLDAPATGLAPIRAVHESNELAPGVPEGIDVVSYATPKASPPDSGLLTDPHACAVAGLMAPALASWVQPHRHAGLH